MSRARRASAAATAAAAMITPARLERLGEHLQERRAAGGPAAASLCAACWSSTWYCSAMLGHVELDSDKGDAQMTKTMMFCVRQIMKNSLRMYFAPLRGAYRGVGSYIQHLNRDIELRRKAEKESCERVRST